MAAKLTMQMHFVVLNIVTKMPLRRVLMLLKLHINLGLPVEALEADSGGEETEQNMDIMDFLILIITMILRILMEQAKL